MIPKNKIEEAAELYTGISLRLLVPEAEITNTAEDLYNYSILDFKSGVEFAEKELENLAIEFAEWIVDDLLKCPFSPDNYKWFHNNGNFCANSTQELFEIFKQEKYENTK